jgi:hypothetical protein
LLREKGEVDQGHQNEIENAFRREQELKQKKILTQLKSKYYMLKVNYPKLAERVDSEPIEL